MIIKVDAIIFLVPVSAFDQVRSSLVFISLSLTLSTGFGRGSHGRVLLEVLADYNRKDARINRLDDSLQLWRSVVSNKLLANVNFVLFLNKCDLLQVVLLNS